MYIRIDELWIFKGSVHTMFMTERNCKPFDAGEATIK